MMKRRDFLKKAALIGGLVLLQPSKYLGVMSWIGDSEAIGFPLYSRIETGTLLYDYSSGVAALPNVFIASGPGSYTLTDNSNPQFITVPGSTKSFLLTINATAGLTTVGWDAIINRNFTNVHSFAQSFILNSGSHNGIIFQVFETTAFTAGQQLDFGAGINGLGEVGRSFAYGKKEEMTVLAGGNANNNHVRVRLRISCPAGSQLSMYINSPQVNTYTKPSICLVFDDNWLSTYTEAFAYMSPRKLVGSIAYVSGNTGGSFCSETQINEMLNAGWSIHNHSDTHTNFTALSQAQIENELLTCKAFLKARKWDRNNIAVYPFGARNSTSDAALEATGYTYGATVNALGMNKQYYGVDNSKFISRVALDGMASANAGIALLLPNIRYGTMGIGVVHQIVVGAIPTQTERDYLRGVIDWITRMRDANLLSVVSLEDWVLQMQNKLPRPRRR